MSEPTDFELWDEISGAEAVAVADLGECGSRLDVCMKCEFRHALVCTRIQPTGSARMNIATVVKRADVTCPEGKWA